MRTKLTPRGKPIAAQRDENFIIVVDSADATTTPTLDRQKGRPEERPSEGEQRRADTREPLTHQNWSRRRLMKKSYWRTCARIVGKS